MCTQVQIDSRYINTSQLTGDKSFSRVVAAAVVVTRYHSCKRLISVCLFVWMRVYTYTGFITQPWYNMYVNIFSGRKSNSLREQTVYCAQYFCIISFRLIPRTPTVSNFPTVISSTAKCVHSCTYKIVISISTLKVLRLFRTIFSHTSSSKLIRWQIFTPRKSAWNKRFSTVRTLRIWRHFHRFIEYFFSRGGEGMI